MTGPLFFPARPWTVHTYHIYFVLGPGVLPKGTSMRLFLSDCIHGGSTDGGVECITYVACHMSPVFVLGFSRKLQVANLELFVPVQLFQEEKTSRTAEEMVVKEANSQAEISQPATTSQFLKISEFHVFKPPYMKQFLSPLTQSYTMGEDHLKTRSSIRTYAGRFFFVFGRYVRIFTEPELGGENRLVKMLSTQSSPHMSRSGAETAEGGAPARLHYSNVTTRYHVCTTFGLLRTLLASEPVNIWKTLKTHLRVHTPVERAIELCLLLLLYHTK